MKMKCDVIQDLLPLYQEELCSEASRELVQAHLAECPRCRAQLAAAERIEFQEVPDPERADAAVAKSFRKVRRRWWTSLIAMLLVVPVTWLTVNQIRGQGLCFTNGDDALRARRYAAALADADWERAAALMDYGHLYDEVQEILAWDLDHYIAHAGELEDPEYHYEFNQEYYAEARDMTEEEFREYVEGHYLEDLRSLEEHGYSFRITGFEDAYYGEGNGGWTICCGMNVTSSGQTRHLTLHILVREGGLSVGAIGYQDMPGEKLDLAEILFLHYPDEDA